MLVENIFKGYSLEYSALAKKMLKSLDKKYAKAIHKKLKQLVAGAPNLNIIKLENYPGYRLRCGDYRAIFEAQHNKIIVYVAKIDHRKDVYRNL